MKIIQLKTSASKPKRGVTFLYEIERIEKQKRLKKERRQKLVIGVIGIIIGFLIMPVSSYVQDQYVEVNKPYFKLEINK